MNVLEIDQVIGSWIIGFRVATMEHMKKVLGLAPWALVD